MKELSDSRAAGPRISLIGCGRWGTNVLRDLIVLGCRVSVADTDVEARDRALAAGAELALATIDQLPESDGTVIACTTAGHAVAIELAAARGGGPIFVEKPLCTDPDEAASLAMRYAGQLFSMDKWRYHPAVEEFARIAASRELGAVESLHLRRVSTAQTQSDIDVVWTVAPHDLAIAQEILGELPPVLNAVDEVAAGRRLGVHAVLGPPVVTLEVSCAASAHRREIKMICERGTVLLDGGWSEHITIRRHDGSSDEARPVIGELPLLAELRAFIDHIDGGEPPKSSAADAALHVRRIVEIGRLAAGSTNAPGQEELERSA